MGSHAVSGRRGAKPQSVRVQLYDAFTERVFGGNIAGVVADARGLSARQMQCIAAEINAPTTGFASPLDAGRFRVTFYTPTQEIDLCGHVVVGVATALAEEGRLTASEGRRATVLFETRAGPVVVEVWFDDGRPACVMMTQNRPRFQETDLERSALTGLLGVPLELQETGLPLQIVSTGLRHLLVPMLGLEGMRRVQPDFPSLAELSRGLGVETVAAFTLETEERGSTMHSRDFCPAIGNPEEAASGTTHGALACYLVQQGVVRVKEGGTAMLSGEQGYEMGRPATIHCEITVQQGEIAQVKVGGTAVRSLTGEIAFPEK